MHLRSSAAGPTDLRTFTSSQTLDNCPPLCYTIKVESDRGTVPSSRQSLRAQLIGRIDDILRANRSDSQRGEIREGSTAKIVDYAQKSPSTFFLGPHQLFLTPSSSAGLYQLPSLRGLTNCRRRVILVAYQIETRPNCDYDKPTLHQLRPQPHNHPRGWGVRLHGDLLPLCRGRGSTPRHSRRRGLRDCSRTRLG